MYQSLITALILVIIQFKKIDVSATKVHPSNKATDGPVTERDGKFSFRVFAPTNSGRGKPQDMKLPYLWDTEEAATNDIPLYKWYKKDHRIKATNEPLKPSNQYKDWFVDSIPDESWDVIHAFLANPIPIVTGEKKIPKSKRNATISYKYESEKELKNLILSQQ
jgi:hypothetical protein